MKNVIIYVATCVIFSQMSYAQLAFERRWPCEMVKTEVQLNDGKKVKASFHLDGKLSPFWSQEFIGADLAQAFLEKEVKQKQIVNVGIIDMNGFLEMLPKSILAKNYLGFEPTRNINDLFSRPENHAVLCANLLMGKAPVGGSGFSQLTVADFDFQSNPDHLNKVLHAIHKTQTQVLSKSISCDGMSEAKSYSLFKPLCEKSIVVQSAGNNFPATIDGDPLKKFKDVITVGSYSPLGIPSGFTQEGEEVTISAPSDWLTYSQLNTANEKKSELVVTGGTSSATPLVAGAISNALALIPQLSPIELKTLLKNSALEAQGSIQEKPQMNGAGMLNSYKLVRVAKRLQEQQWASFPEHEKLQRLSSKDLYDFSEESDQLTIQAKNLFLQSENQLDPNCKMKKMALQLLRKAFLLNSKNEESRDLLEKVYQANGLEYNALFYRGLKSLQDFKWVIAHASQDPHFQIRASAIRALPLLGKKTASILEDSLNSIDSRELEKPHWKKPQEALSHSLVGTVSKIYGLGLNEKHLNEKVMNIFLKMIQKGIMCREDLNNLLQGYSNGSTQKGFLPFAISDENQNRLVKAMISHSNPEYIRDIIRDFEFASSKLLLDWLKSENPRIREATIECVQTMKFPVDFDSFNEKFLSELSQYLNDITVLLSLGVKDKDSSVRYQTKKTLAMFTESFQRLLSLPLPIPGELKGKFQTIVGQFIKELELIAKTPEVTLYSVILRLFQSVASLPK